MGGRLSMPRSPNGLSEVSKPTSSNFRRRSLINGRTVVAPFAALTMAALLFVYSRTSIRAAKLNAQRHRERDGGQINWHNESLRRHGQLDKVEDKGLLKDALLGGEKDAKEAEDVRPGVRRSAEENKLRKIMGKEEE